MRVPARVWADEELWPQISRDRTLQQLINVATLPGHRRRGPGDAGHPRGLRLPGRRRRRLRARDGVISPGGVGYDINCGVRLLASEIEADELGARPAGSARSTISPRHPLGHGAGEPSPFRGRRSSTASWPRGAPYLAERGLATPEDLETIEARRIAATAPTRGRSPTAPSSAAAASSARSAPATTSSRCSWSRSSSTHAAAEALRAARGAGGDPDPHRLARAGPPGLHRLRARRWTR